MLDRKARRAAAAGIAVLMVAAMQDAASASTQQPGQAQSTAAVVTQPTAVTAQRPVINPQFKANNGEAVASLHAEVAAGTLLRGHGTRKVCPLCDGEIVTTAKSASTPLASTAPA